MARLELKYRLEGKALPPQPIRVSFPNWGGDPAMKKVNGSQPQPWHCPLHVEGNTHGVELLYQYETECQIVNDEGRIRIVWDRASEPGGPAPSDFTLSVPPPSQNYLFATSIDLQAPPGYVLRTEPHPRYFADTTGTAPAAMYGHLHTEWWPKKIFVVFKIPAPGQRHVFRKGDPYCQVLCIPADDVCTVVPMNDEERAQRRRLEDEIKIAKSLIGKNVWHSAGGVEFNDHYKVLARAYERDGLAGVEAVVREACDRYDAIVPKGKSIAEYFELARQRIAEKKPTHAKEILHQVMRQEPDNPEVYNRIGLLQWDLGVVEDAIRTLRRAVDLQPRWPAYRYNLGEMYRRLGRFDQAEGEYQAALAIDPNDAEIQSVMGFSMAQRGLLAEGLGRCKAAIAVNGRSAVLHFRAGMILGQLKRDAEARECFDAALAVDPAFTPAREALARGKAADTSSASV